MSYERDCLRYYKMLSGGLKTVLLFLSLGFLIIWFLEFRRTSLADSYWLLLLLLICLFWYQLINLKASDGKSQTSADRDGGVKKKVSKTASKKKNK